MTVRPEDRKPETPFPTTYTRQMSERFATQRRAEIEAAVKARQERDAKLAEEREQKAKERAAAELEAYREDRRRHWVAATGSEEGFASAWPTLRAAWVADRLDPVEQAKAELRAQHGTL